MPTPPRNTAPTERARGPRKDTLRNRARLLEAAARAFRAHGPDVSAETVARTAGVGATTFYRHFPGKEDLVATLLTDLSEGAREVADAARAEPDAWTAFSEVFSRGCVLSDDDLALFDALCRTGPEAAALGRRITAGLIAPVVLRAQAAGVLRDDVDADDVAAFMRMAGGAGGPDEDADGARRRAKAHAVLLAGLRAHPG